MSVYKFIDLENSDILLQTVLIDNSNYNVITNKNGDKILKKINNIKITDLKLIKDCDFKNQ
jgi:hypothetical protein